MAGEIPEFDILKVIGNTNKLRPWIRRKPFEPHLIEALYPLGVVTRTLQEFLASQFEFKKDFFSFRNSKIIGKAKDLVTFYSHPFYVDTRDSVPQGTVHVTDGGNIDCMMGEYWKIENFDLYDPRRLRFELIIDQLYWKNKDQRTINLLESKNNLNTVSSYPLSGLNLTLIPQVTCPADVFDRTREIEFGLNQVQLLLQLCHALVTKGVDYNTHAPRISRYSL